MKGNRLVGLFFASIVVQICLAILLRTSWKLLFKVTPHHETTTIDTKKRSQDGMSHPEESIKQKNFTNAFWQKIKLTENPNLNITHLEDVKHILSRPRQKDPHLDSHIKPEKEYDVAERLHFIWIGSKLPTKYIKNIETFRTQNKQYEIYLWLDDNSYSKPCRIKVFMFRKYKHHF